MKILFSLLFTLLFFSGFAQFDTTRPFQKINAFGYQYKNFRIDSSFRGPRDTFRLSINDTGAIAVIGRTPYVWNKNNGVLRWDTLAGGGTTIIEGGGGTVDLDTSRTGTTVNIIPDGGTTATIKSADSLLAGVMIAVDKRKLDKLELYNSLLDKGIIKEVSEYPAGITNDGIFGFLSGTVKFIRVKKGEVYAEEAGILADGSDQTSRINAVFANPKIKYINFHYDGGGIINIAGTVTIPTGKVLKFSPGSSFNITGSGAINGGLYDVDDFSVIFTGTQNVNPEGFTRGYIPPSAWGFIPNTGVDVTPKLQKAIDWGINSSTQKNIIISQFGTYLVANAVIAKYVGGNATQCSVSIMGAVSSLSQGVVFRNTNLNAATIHIQVGYDINIKNIFFEGIGPDVANFVTAETPQWTAAVGGGTIRTNQKSPGQTAISIDNFYKIGAYNSTITSSTDYYPGLSAYYTNEAYSGSTNINMDKCSFTRMYVGVVQGVSGCPNGEGLHINGGFGLYVANMWVAGQLQSRKNTIRDFYFIYGHTFVTNTWGTGIGDIPDIEGNVNYVKYMSITAGNFTAPHFKIYGEGLYSLGINYGSTPIGYESSTLQRTPNDVLTPTIGMTPVFFQSVGPISFKNCNIHSGDYFSALTINAQSVTFDNCRIEGGLPINSSDDFFDNIHFKNSVWKGNQGGGSARIDEDRNETFYDNGVYYKRDLGLLMPGSKLKSAVDFREFERIGDKYYKIPIASTGIVTVDSSTMSLTFVSTTPGIFLTGDIIYTTTSVDNTNDLYNSAKTTLGYVSAISGTTITLSHIPYGVINGGTYEMYIVRIPQHVGRALGNLVSGTNTITNVLSDNGTFTVSERINGNGIIPGTYITNISGTTFTISTNATVTANTVELYDGKSRVSVDDKPFYYFGGTTDYDNLGVIWFQGDIRKNVTPGVHSKEKVCISPGKIGSAFPPTFITIQENTANVAILDANNTFTGTLNNWPGYKTSGEKIRIGSFHIQPYALNNLHLTDNLRYDAGWKLREAGYGAGINLVNGGFDFYGTTSGSVDEVKTLQSLLILERGTGPKFPTILGSGEVATNVDADGKLKRGTTYPSLTQFLDSLSNIRDDMAGFADTTAYSVDLYLGKYLKGLNTDSLPLDVDSAILIHEVDSIIGVRIAAIPDASTSIRGLLTTVDYNRSYIRQTALSNPTGTITFNIANGGQANVTFTSTGGRTVAYSNLRSGDLVRWTIDNTSGASITLTLPSNSFVNDVGSSSTIIIPEGKSILDLGSYDGTNYYYSLTFFSSPL